MNRLRTFFGVLGTLAIAGGISRAADFQAGAAVIDVTPEKLPVLVNGSMLGGKADSVKTRVNARAIALADDRTKIVMVVVDSCMMPRPLLDEAKKRASEKTGIPTSHLLMSATHTHSAPSCMGALGTMADENYVPFLTNKLVEAVETAVANLEPARVGFAKADAADYTALRQWIRRPDKVVEDPFGNLTVRAN
ncbi:MAG: neutral/alkaline non-lysosomal ceramidase N-terminal domain-containing protein, partial [Verrucomicrobiae bacterium]|nr:neutral/alkaline non-lysosomal ceramidase N-terminal domain-containing protein [Verrucomicrobiae bacterium]